MYKLKDYLLNGMLYLNNISRPRHKRLSQLMIYSTTNCQSRCKHCSIWKKEEENLSLEDIKSIMTSKCVTSQTTVGLEGGNLFSILRLMLSWNGSALTIPTTRY